MPWATQNHFNSPLLCWSGGRNVQTWFFFWWSEWTGPFNICSLSLSLRWNEMAYQKSIFFMLKEKDMQASGAMQPKIVSDAKNKSLEGEIVLTTKERNVTLRFRARPSCLPKRKQGHDIVLAPEFVNSKHLGQLLIQLCITSYWQAGQGCQSTF